MGKTISGTTLVEFNDNLVAEIREELSVRGLEGTEVSFHEHDSRLYSIYVKTLCGDYFEGNGVWGAHVTELLLAETPEDYFITLFNAVRSWNAPRGGPPRSSPSELRTAAEVYEVTESFLKRNFKEETPEFEKIIYSASK